MSEISEQEERRNYEYLMEKVNSKGKKKLSKQQKKSLKQLSEKFSNSYGKVKKTKEHLARELQRKQQRIFNNTDLNGKLMMIFGSFVKGFTSYIKELIIYLTAISSVFYLYYKFENKSTEKIFPKESNKFPYVFVDDKLDYDEQFNLTTINIKDNENNLSEPVYFKVENEDTNEQIKNKINQPTNSTINDMDLFAKFFNYTSSGKKPYEINIIQIISHALLSGIIGINTFYYFVHENILKNLYIMNSELSKPNKTGDSNSENSNNNNDNIIKNMFGSLFTIGVTTILFFLFRLSKNDLSDLLKPFIDQSVFDSKIKNVFGLEEILNFFSSLFSGFFTGFKLLFVVSFVVFIGTSLISLYKLTNNVSNISSVFIIFSVVLAYFASIVFFGMFVGGKLKNNQGFSTNDLFNSIFNIFERYMNLFKTFIDKNPFGTSLLNTNNNSYGIFSNAITILSLMLLLPFLPIFLVFLFAIIIIITFSFTPILASLYMGIKLAFDTALYGVFKIGNFTKAFARNYIPLVISFILCFVVLLNRNESGNIVKLIEGILNVILIVLSIIFILIFGKFNKLKIDGSNESTISEIAEKTVKSLGIPISIAVVATGSFIYNLIQNYKRNN